MDPVSTRRQVAAWAAMAMLVIVLLDVVMVLYRNTAALIIGLVGLTLVALAGWRLMTEAGARRIVAAIIGIIGLALLVVAFVLVISRPEHAVLRAVLQLAVLAVTWALVRYALTRPPQQPANITATRHRPTKPVLLCNPWSGGGKVEQHGLVALADELGVETVLLAEGLDLEKLTRDAVAGGADCLGMAGGDGSQALVASVAAEHDLPFVCIPAGTRNHFALDLGLDRDDPRAAMAAFHDAIERRIDFATVNDRLFVNNVSLGIYATIVQSDAYRDHKAEVSRSTTTELLGTQAEEFDLQYSTPEGQEVDGAFLIMVSNNPYVLGANPDLSQRRELDTGELGVFAISTRTGAQAARLVTLAAIGMRDVSKHWYEFTAEEFEVRSRSGSAYAGVDGEALEMSTPMRFAIHPGGLRLFVPEGNLVIAEQRRARQLRVDELVGVALGREGGGGRDTPAT